MRHGDISNLPAPIVFVDGESVFVNKSTGLRALVAKLTRPRYEASQEAVQYLRDIASMGYTPVIVWVQYRYPDAYFSSDYTFPRQPRFFGSWAAIVDAAGRSPSVAAVVSENASGESVYPFADFIAHASRRASWISTERTSRRSSLRGGSKTR